MPLSQLGPKALPPYVRGPRPNALSPRRLEARPVYGPYIEDGLPSIPLAAVSIPASSLASVRIAAVLGQWHSSPRYLKRKI